ncbi:flagellar basal-body MS-ring/collar protein FliF [Tenuibacillus multivorans]|uniref:Flagellar M-ring protein n=1 Tax=Tenuibacillus multivorans TaxID=237069 RepID=A0A1G9Y093_9BACI|nr:flagellar basal-body MS-ring/collar protein FliF [Tenuibacillus multivorans]GEL75881.1 flagellar M-ring protein [Tenuibacillus multivorans]SDN02061.1 flagellar M-ring protein FliF [Tenuibacillus multivorans]
MNETVQSYRNKIVEFWGGRSKSQKFGIIGGFIGAILLLVLLTVMLTASNMVPLYSNLTHQEAGQLTSELDDRGVQYEIADGGTTIMVPESKSDQLIVELAAQGIPNSGNIDYSFFSENVSWGMTDEERQIIELDAMQSELGSLISTIDGIQSAKVLINRPTETVFVGDQPEASSASIVLNTQYGYDITQNQVRGLYHLVSKAVPNLPTENIVIMNQNFEYFDLDDSNSIGTGNTYAEQQKIKEDIERDLQRQVQRLLGTMMGQGKVVVSVTTDIDFTSENRVEELVEPVDLENMEGLPVSVERVTETYAGIDGSNIPADVTDIPEYLAEGDTDQLSDYEQVRETINNEFNRVRREIVESPYEIRDLGIQVAVDNTIEENGEVVTLSAAEQQSVQGDVEQILSSMIETSISSDVSNEQDFDPAQKVSIAFQPFSDGPSAQQTEATIPTWVYVVGGILILSIILLIYLMMRRRNDEEEWVEFEETSQDVSEEVPPIEENLTESDARKKQLEKMAKEKPEEFAKLLRTWISED